MNTSTGSIKGQDIIKAVDDNINIDMINRTEDVENALLVREQTARKEIGH